MDFDPDARNEEILGSPPRLEPLPDVVLDEQSKNLVYRVRALHGLQRDLPPHPIITTLSRNPPFFRYFYEAADLFGTVSTLSVRERELAILRTVWLCGSPFGWVEHVTKAKMAGISSEEIERITEGSTAEGWTDAERALLSAAEELHDNAMITDATWAQLAEFLHEDQLVELPILVGHYHLTAFVQNSLRFVPRDGTLGLATR